MQILKKEQTLLKNIGSWINDKLANVVIKKPKKFTYHLLK